MAVQNFSTLSSGQSVAFDPNADMLFFDQSAISAANLGVTQEGANSRVSVLSGVDAGKFVVLTNTIPMQLATSNVSFANGSQLLFGDNSTALNDDAANTLNGTAGNDLLYGFGGGDTLIGRSGNDAMFGMDGDDSFDMNPAGASYGSDTIDGGAGTDTVDFAGSTALSGAVVNLAAGTMSGGGAGGAGSATLVSIENVMGSQFGDRVTGDGGANYFYGWYGNDTLDGGAGDDTLDGAQENDVLNGGAGNDVLTGGAGADSFIFNQTPGAANADQITDFASGTDKIRLDASVMTALGAAGDFSATDARFYAAAGATGGHDADDRVIYNTSTGELFYDADGNGAGAAQLIATLQSGAVLAATDIAVDGTVPAGGQVINGTPGDDTLVGGPGNDTINGFAGNDSLSGLGGDDSLDGGDGNDTLDGGAGADTLNGGLGDDAYMNPAANDVIIDAGGTDTFIFTDWGGSLPLGSGIENLILRGTGGLPSGNIANGNELNNVIRNENTNAAWIDGGDGNDTLIGGSGTEFFTFAAGSGNYGNDSVDGGAGGDWLFFEAAKSAVVVDFRAGTVTGGGSGGSGSVSFTNIETAMGGSFNDRLIANDSGIGLMGWGGDDTLIGGAGDDQLDGDGSFDSRKPAPGNDSISGGAGNDSISGDGGNDTLDGGTGNDTFFFNIATGGDYGNDVVDGGDGVDSIRLINFQSDAVVDLAAGTMTGGATGGSGSAKLTSIENFSVINGAFNVRVTGSAAGNVLAGAEGNDSIDGGAGNDTLTGGAGSDSFIFSQAPGTANADVIADFTSGSDKVRLDATVMSALGASGNFAAGDVRFFAAAGATGGHDADDRVVFNTATGQLFYDADGNGAGAAQLIATLQSGATLVATDIAVDNGSVGGQVINGTPGNDSLVGGPGNDTINGFEGNDTLLGLGGDDVLIGGSGDNLMDGGAGNDSISGDVGRDTLIGGAGNDTLNGGGNDQYVFNVAPGAANADLIVNFSNSKVHLDASVFANAGQTGNFTPNDSRFFWGPGATSGHDADDRVVFDTSTGNLWYDADGNGAGAAQLIATLINTNGSPPSISAFNIIIDNGAPQGQTITGTAGDDSLVGGPGYDTISGVGGNDTLRGLGGDDFLFGGSGNDLLDGGAGNDILEGNDGNDTLIGGLGNDILDGFGGFGVDHYVFDVAPGADNADEIHNFESGTAKIHLDSKVFAYAGPLGNFTDNDPRFYAAPGASSGHAAGDRVIFDTSALKLWYDADGNGAGQAQLVASLTMDIAFAGSPIFTRVLAKDIIIDNGTAPGQTINGTAGNDSLVGGPGNDTLNGFAGNDTLDGQGGFDQLNGGLGDDTYMVSGDGDTIVADPGGIDTVIAANTSWTLGAGLDNLDLNASSGGPYFGFGNELDNVIRGASTGGDLRGMGGNDLLIIRAVLDPQKDYPRANGGDGNDTLQGGDGNNILSGDAGDDVLVAGPNANNIMSGGTGADSFVFRFTPGSANDQITDFASGIDKVRLDATVMAALGTSGNFAAGDVRFFAAAGATSGHDADDRVVYNTTTGQLFYDADGNGAGAAQLIATLQGAPALAATDIAVDNGTAPPAGQTIIGTAGNDSLVGGPGNDSISGLAGDDTLIGGDGNDTLDGGPGVDSMDGGLGNDTYYVTAGDILTDAGGIDTVITDTSWELTPRVFENLTLIGNANRTTLGGNNLDNIIIGNDFDSSSINGRAGNDTMYGMGGNDTFDMSAGGTASYGNDYIDGGSGTDTVDFGGSSAQSGIVVNLGAGTLSGGGAAGAGSATLVSIENIMGTQFGDRITGSAADNYFYAWIGDDTLDGGAGNDTMNGVTGNDVLNGGAGNDVLVGGAGNDIFIFDQAPAAANADQILDFATAADKLQLDHNVMAALGATGNFASGDVRFFAAAGATAGHDADDRVVYDTSTGQLYYDDDGSGAHAAQLLVTLQAGAALAATDIAVI